MTPRSFDVGVIGAGVHGASAAYHLAAKGLDVVIFDKGAPAGGPTGRSSGICRAYYTNPFLAEIARDSIAMLEDFADLTGGESGFRRTGFLFLHPVADVNKSVENAATLNELGVLVEVLDRHMLEAEFPMFDLDGIGCGIWETDAGYADPSLTTLGFLEAAIRRGAQPRLGSEIVSIDASTHSVALTSSDGQITHCDRLLIAAGPWTAPLAMNVGVHLPLTVERHVVASAAWGSVPPLPFGHADLIHDYYMKPEGESLFLLGWLAPAANADADGYMETITDQEGEDLIGAAVKRVPALEGAAPLRGWAGLYDVSPDWQPVIGEIADHIYVDAGTSGHGFKLAPALGRYVAELVISGTAIPELEQFHPRRFAHEELLAAGWGEARILG